MYVSECIYIVNFLIIFRPKSILTKLSQYSYLIRNLHNILLYIFIIFVKFCISYAASIILILPFKTEDNHKNIINFLLTYCCMFTKKLNDTVIISLQLIWYSFPFWLIQYSAASLWWVTLMICRYCRIKHSDSFMKVRRLSWH